MVHVCGLCVCMHTCFQERMSLHGYEFGRYLASLKRYLVVTDNECPI